MLRVLPIGLLGRTWKGWVKPGIPGQPSGARIAGGSGCSPGCSVLVVHITATSRTSRLLPTPPCSSSSCSGGGFLGCPVRVGGGVPVGSAGPMCAVGRRCSWLLAGLGRVKGAATFPPPWGGEELLAPGPGPAHK